MQLTPAQHKKQMELQAESQVESKSVTNDSAKPPVLLPKAPKFPKFGNPKMSAFSINIRSKPAICRRNSPSQ
jgi:hypothetical protein